MQVRGHWFVVGSVVLLLGGTNVVRADGWLAITPAGDVGMKEITEAAPPALAVQDGGLGGFQVTVTVPGLTVGPQKTAVGEFVRVGWPGAPLAGEIGAPAIPVVRRLFIAPAGAAVTVTTWAGAGHVVDSGTIGARLRLMPVQPPLPKEAGARERAQFAFEAAAYSVAADCAPQRATVTELGLVRGQRLMLLEVWPVSYHPVAEQVRFWPQIVADVRFAGGAAPAGGLSPLPGLTRVVLNPNVLPGTDGRGAGNYLIVVASAYASDITAFASAKQAQGYTVTTWTAAPGTTNTQIKTYILSLWANPATAPDYVLLVGDTNTMPYWIGGGEGSPNTDLPYACMDGTGDWYPDLAIGRFPVRSPAQLQAMISKTLYYENGPLADPGYVKRAVFMASEDNYPISEGTHNYVINTHLAPHEYVSDKLYCHTYNATTQQVRNSFNAGRFYGIYSGHGGTDYWADGPVFHQSDVNGLTNANMYAFICSFACLTGDFASTSYPECFMETWVLAANRAAVTAWGSSVTSYWDEDDILERVLFDAIFAEPPPVVSAVGPMFNEAKARYLAHWGPTGTTRRYFEMYNLLGDPALPFPGACSDAGTIELDSPKYACADTATIRVVDCGPNANPGAVETVTVDIDSTSETGVETVLLTETGPNTAIFQGSIGLSTTNAAGVLLVAAGDTVTATYEDADNGQGQPATVTATAIVDCTGPTISNVHATNVAPRSATIAFTTNEPTRGIVHYGLDCGHLNQTATGSGYSTSPTVDLSNLQDGTTYFYMVEAEDEAGNITADPNCYSFWTPAVPDYFTELFDTGNNDLDNRSLYFTPGNVVPYFGCTDPISTLPTDPTGGTTLVLGDDDFKLVTLGGGMMVFLYDVGYTKFYVGSNGYITFNSGDQEWEESLAAHFSKPRVSALFDDFDPTAGGTISWKQLADRVAVTWKNLPEWGTANLNTFQIELFFGGHIRISYLAIAATDGLAGLSKGQGVPPDYFPSDLSAMEACLLGDLNCDGALNAFDIDPFVLALTNPAGYAAAWPNCDRMRADCNGDGVVDAFDIDPFVDLLTP